MRCQRSNGNLRASVTRNRRLLERMLTAASVAGSDLLYENTFKLSAKLIRELGKNQKSKNELMIAGQDTLRPYLSSLQLDLRDAKSSTDALAALANKCIVYGKHADIAISIVLTARDTERRLQIGFQLRQSCPSRRETE
jgi:hypothetical protein